MSTKYKATTTEEAYFVTMTTVGWVDVFTRLNQKQNIIEALDYCQKHKVWEMLLTDVNLYPHAELAETNWFIKQKN